LEENETLRWKSFFALLGILSASVFLLFFATRTAQKPDHIIKKELVFTCKRKDVRSFEVVTQSWGIRFFKKEGSWISEPKILLLDQGLIEEVLDDLLSIEVLSTVGRRRELDQSQFGFEKPTMVMTMDDEAGLHASLTIGVIHPTGTAYYAIKDKGEDIFLVGSLYGETLRVRIEKLFKEETLRK
jgi:hypothetical protein